MSYDAFKDKSREAGIMKFILNFLLTDLEKNVRVNIVYFPKVDQNRT